jgi:hypothetical protein
MGSDRTIFNRLRNKSVKELLSRSRQEAAKLSGRAFGLATGEMSDRAFLRRFDCGFDSHSAEVAALRFIERIRDTIASDSASYNFFPSLQQRISLVNRVKRDFPGQERLLLNRADRALDGWFDLLGLTNLSFGTPPDWLLEPVSGIRSTLDHWSAIDYLDPRLAGDKKITWELNRHQHFVTLGQAYWLTADEKYAEGFVDQATSWMDANPPNLGINWASSLELAFRSISWLWALHLFAESPRLTPSFVLRLLKHLIAQGTHIHSYLSSYFSPNTHLTGEALGLLYVGLTLPEIRSSKKWREEGLKILLEQFPRHVSNDGVYFEQSTYYHRYTADFYIHLLILARAGNIELPNEMTERLAKMITHLVCIMRPDGSSPLIGDDDGGRLCILGPRDSDDFRDTIATAAALYGRADWKHAAGNNSFETLWLLGTDGVDRYVELPDVVPLENSTIFPFGGQVVFRDGRSRDATYALMDCGPHGSLSFGHSHADALSIEFAALGRSWIVDPGTFTYTGDGESRNWFRSTGAHNTITVDDQSQSIVGGPFSWKTVARSRLEDFIIADFDFACGSHNGYERLPDPVLHTRTLIGPKRDASVDSAEALQSYLIVRDSLVASQTHKYSLRYHLSPGCSAFALDNQVRVTEPGGRRLAIAVFGSAKINAQIQESWVSRAYGHRERSQVAVFELEASGAQEFVTFLVPSYEGQAVSIESRSTGVESRAFQVSSFETTDCVLIGSATRPKNGGFITADGSVAWGRFVGSDFQRGFLVGGSSFETDDGFGFRSESAVRYCSLRCLDGGLAIEIDGDRFELNGGELAQHFSCKATSFEVFRPDPTSCEQKNGWDFRRTTGVTG